jgi:hypothetical protein
MILPNEIIVDITPEDARNAKEYMCNDCLLGTAVKRQLNAKSTIVGSIYIIIDNESFRIVEHEKIRDTYGFGTHHATVETPFQVTLTKI